MPWRLIAFLIVLTIVVLFAGFNLTNVSNISFGFYTLQQVPVFLSLFVAFLLGAVLVLPFAVRNRNAKGTRQISRETKRDGTNLPPATATVSPVQEQPAEQPTEPPPKKRAKKK